MKFLKLKKKIQEKKNNMLKKTLRRNTKVNLKSYLSKAGIKIQSRLLSKGIFKIAMALNLIATIYLIFFFSTSDGYSWIYISLIVFFMWFLVFFIILALVWLLFYLFLDLRIFKRKLTIEEVLPDFLFLAATNIRSGMTIDRALWFAIRPRFGVLTKEIEVVAKEVMSGADLTVSLEGFANKYNSDILTRSIHLLNEGIRSGGEVGGLLTRVASNIQESRLMRKEMSADVTTYVIFITFAAIIAAPALLALSSQLIVIIAEIVSKIDVGSSAGTMFTVTDVAVSSADFTIFSIASLIVSSMFSAIIVATIKKGNIKAGAKYIPSFIAVSILVYLFTSFLLSRLLSGFFT